jgi:hypothetical protein
VRTERGEPLYRRPRLFPGLASSEMCRRGIRRARVSISGTPQLLRSVGLIAGGWSADCMVPVRRTGARVVQGVSLGYLRAQEAGP